MLACSTIKNVNSLHTTVLLFHKIQSIIISKQTEDMQIQESRFHILFYAPTFLTKPVKENNYPVLQRQKDNEKLSGGIYM